MYELYTFSCLEINHSINFIKKFDSSSVLFKERFNNNNYYLIVVSSALSGVFLNHSDIMPFTLCQKMYDDFGKTKEDPSGCKIVNLPNLLDPRLVDEFLKIPIKIRTPISDKNVWTPMFVTMLKEIDPGFENIEILELDETLKQCRICKEGYKVCDNKADSCEFHPNSIESVQSSSSIITGIWRCCGQTIYKYNYNFAPCRKGYHIPFENAKAEKL